MHAPSLTALYAAGFAVFIVLLALHVVRMRRKHQVGLGAGGVKYVERAIRVHGNAVEYVPMALLMMALYEMNGGNAVLVHAFGGALALGRLLHAYGLSRRSGTSFGRFWGTTLTILVWLGLAGANVALYLSPGS
jgi:uncharacterized membrane protein YecN with MAPEG domain